MKIREMISKGEPTVSFEIFPPKSSYALETVFETLTELKDLHPDFISVTYGAGGTAQSNTVEIASRIKKDFGIESIAHLTGCTSTKEGMKRTLTSIKDSGIENILALRGDIPQEKLADKNWNPEYRYASELIDDIKAAGDFSIGAACYPEGHVDSINKVDDLKNLKRKMDHGADFMITQLFYDNDLFYQFKEKLDLVGIEQPVIAGILPVLNIKQVKRIQEISGCNLPPKFLRILDRYAHDPASLQEAGIAYAVDQIIDLLSSGVDGVHIYTMNKPDATR
ncbi:MAG: methylenetetrahydrofolate reductase [NAD(P)H], partial [Bacilli bacterium]|nr:methylenetetrahydrofolate reductase [NAD(P)H] [Bacilli bacterium]